ncbi:MAG: PEP-CTERM sorting domain-containing protein [Kiritimatiellae bacterium]|jgi:hypothetical protein|nr:PEP-CTERM sorting domain-containing protein [Kiritimatiellia bacterium]
MKKPFSTLLTYSVSVLALCLACNVRADILVAYDFSTDLSATTSGTGVTTYDFEPVGVAAYSGFNQSVFIRSDATGGDETAALADDDYFSFTIEASTPGELLDLDTLVFDFGGSANNAGEYESTIYLQSSVGGVGSENPVLFTDTHTVPAGSTGTSGLTSGVVADLSSLANVSSITFQFRFSDNVTNSDQINRLDSVLLNGSTVIPEPSTFMLLLGGVVAFGLLTRRRRS